jgi:hypothetical protein
VLPGVYVSIGAGVAVSGPAAAAQEAVRLCPDDASSNIVARIGGSGQRLHFSFGGELTLRANNQLAGDYIVVVAPQAPAGSVLAITCRYRQFSDGRLDNGNQLRFTGRGQCTRLAQSGAVTQFNVVSDFTIVDNGANNDEIGMAMKGATGIMLPNGTLSHGDLTIHAVN